MNRLHEAARCLALVLALMHGTALAQEKIHFDPARDLPSFEEARSSDYKELYTLDPYIDLLGKDMDKAELAKVQAQWKADLAVAQKHVSDLTNSPKEGHAFLLTTRLAKHKFFSKIAYTTDTSTPPFFLIVQKPPRDDPAYADGIAKQFVPYMVKLAAIFEARVAKPAGVARRADSPWTPVAILASPGDFQNFRRVSNKVFGTTNGAAYDPDVELVVGYIDAFDNSKDSTSVVYPVMREMFTTLFGAYVLPPAMTMETLWLEQGLASAFAYPKTPKLESLDEPEPRGDVIARVVEINHDRAKRGGLLFPIRQLAQVHLFTDLQSLAAGNINPAKFDARESVIAFQYESALWMHFLWNGPEHKYHAAFERYVKLAMTGLGGADALSLAFAGAKLADVDREFWSWVYDQHQRVFPKLELDRGDLADMFTKPPKEVVVDEIATKARESLKKSSAAKPPEPPFVPATLAIAADDFESRHGMALVLARSGDLEGAKSALQALVQAKPPVPDDGRIARDLERVGAAIQLRDAYLDSLKQKNARLAIEHDGKKINAPVAKIENGEVIFAENKQGVKSLPLRSLDPLDIAKLAEKKETQGNAPTWTRAWIYLLAGDAKWEKLLKLDSDAARDMREDGNVWYRDRLRAGKAALAIDALAKNALPKTSAEAQPIFASLQDLGSTAGDLSVVAKKKSGLKRFARAALDVLSADVDPAEAVHGKLTHESDGTITLEYTFKDPREALDFQRDAGHLVDWRKSWDKVSIKEEDSRLELRGGALHMVGDTFWKLPLGFAAPMTAMIEFGFQDDKSVAHAAPYAALHICDNGKDSYIHCSTYGQLHVFDEQASLATSTGNLMSQFRDARSYRLELRHDGKEVVATIDDKEMGKGAAGPRVSGLVEINVHSELDFIVKRLEVHGKIDPESLTALRHAWAERKLAETGF